MNIDDFEAGVRMKADKDNLITVEKKIKFLELQYKETMVVLNETLGLH